MKSNIDEIIEMTGQSNALQAVNLSKLLFPKWTEERDAYEIESKITTNKQKRRLNDLLRRY